MLQSTDFIVRDFKNDKNTSKGGFRREIRPYCRRWPNLLAFNIGKTNSNEYET